MDPASVKAVPVLTEDGRSRIDESDDALFYAEARFVHHLDGAFRARLTQLYRECLAPGSTLLDLMSSWVSHLPEDVPFREVIGHGLNGDELAANPRLDRFFVQNLNAVQALPLETGCVDAAMVVAGWQYLRQPEPVALELRRVLRPGGQLIVAFSNRLFPTKAPRAWLEASDRDRLATVAKVLLAQGWELERVIAEDTRAEGPMGWIGGKGDPFLAVIARTPSA